MVAGSPVQGLMSWKVSVTPWNGIVVDVACAKAGPAMSPSSRGTSSKNSFRAIGHSLAVGPLCSPEKPRRQPMDPPPPAGQEQSPHRRNVQLLQIDGKVRVHCRYCASSQVSAPAVPSTCPKRVFPTFDRMLSLALVMAMICGHDHHDHHRDPRSRATVAGGPAPAPRPSTPLRRPAPG